MTRTHIALACAALALGAACSLPADSDSPSLDTDGLGTPAAQETTKAATPKPTGPVTVIDDGTWTVGVDIVAGTYRAVGAGADCYWAILKSGTNGSDIVNNGLGGGNLTVTLKVGQDFETKRCGTWNKTA